jgi:hypothetical protein
MASATTQEPRCNMCGEDNNLMDKPKTREYDICTDSCSSTTSQSSLGPYACSTFCKGKPCMRMYGVFINSKCLNLINGVPYRFTPAYPNSVPITACEVLTCGYCGISNNNVVRNFRIKKNGLYTDFCKNTTCCSDYIAYMKQKPYVPFSERTNLIKDWLSTSPTQPPLVKCDNKDVTDMRYESNRLKSFGNSWPSSYVTPEQLAAAGFHYLKWEDHVTCRYCRVGVSKWVEGDNAWDDHLKYSPNCPFLSGELYAPNYSIKNESF